MFRFVLRILPAVPVWLAYQLIMLPLIILGFPLCAVGALWYQYQFKFTGHTRATPILHWPRWMWLWDNEEDGIDGDPWTSAGDEPKNPEWFEATAGWFLWRRIFVWSAWRNSVGNARFTRALGMTVTPKDVILSVPLGNLYLEQAVTTWNEYRKTGPYLARQGWRFELRFPWGDWTVGQGEKMGGIYPPRFFWIGWRIAQQDKPNTNVGFAFQPWGKV